ncbi:hypothetical protein FA13DRAFT_1716545 [Coprinellus micaceus]|uniref:Uncharacterized protein n=1 Tax=Coprinellus micaceus TaxID=71717 RepID=A0A4Y7SIW5_COPMI|nr:hypothetical protein FA13DRAFT_1716545 [Coprinellus micaceus]
MCHIDCGQQTLTYHPSISEPVHMESTSTTWIISQDKKSDFTFSLVSAAGLAIPLVKIQSEFIDSEGVLLAGFPVVRMPGNESSPWDAYKDFRTTDDRVTTKKNNFSEEAADNVDGGLLVKPEGKDLGTGKDLWARAGASRKLKASIDILELFAGGGFHWNHLTPLFGKPSYLTLKLTSTPRPHLRKGEVWHDHTTCLSREWD